MRAFAAIAFAVFLLCLPVAWAAAQDDRQPVLDLDHVVSSFAVAAQQNGTWEWDVFMADKKTVIRGKSPTFERAVHDVLVLMSRRVARNS